jgi:hypothetical protein
VGLSGTPAEFSEAQTHATSRLMSIGRPIMEMPSNWVDRAHVVTHRSRAGE